MFNGHSNYVPLNLMVLSLAFLGGTLIYLYRERIPDSALLTVVCMVAFVATLYLPTGGHGWTVNPSKFGVFLLAYPLLWLGAHLPFSWIGSKNDYSYGVYIYGYPLTMLLVSLRAERVGFWPFMGLTAVFHPCLRRSQLVAGREARTSTQEGDRPPTDLFPPAVVVPSGPAGIKWARGE